MPLREKRVWRFRTLRWSMFESGRRRPQWLPLEIDSELAIGPDDEVRADADGVRNVAVGVGDRAIASVIGDAVLRAFERGANEAFAETFRLALAVGRRRRRENDDRSDEVSPKQCLI